MHTVGNILAASEGEGVKFLFGLIFVLIWFATSAMSALAKKKKPPATTAARRPIPLPPRSRNVPTISKPKLAPARVQKPAPLPAAPAAFVPSTLTRVRAFSGGPTLVHTSPRADVLRSLLRPQALQQQFMLTEVLQPPVSLRRDW
jgi:hypothetical protein